MPDRMSFMSDRMPNKMSECKNHCKIECKKTYVIHIMSAVGPSLTSSAAVSAEPRELVATPWTIFFVDLLVLPFLILPVPVWLPASVVGFAVGLG